MLKENVNKAKALDEIIQIVNDKVQEFHWPTDYVVRDALPITRNNKSDFNALKIEDTARLYAGVLDAKIKTESNGEYDYSLKLLLDSSLENVDVNKLIYDINEHIKKIANIIKFNVGKINYILEYEKIKYVDADKSKKEKYNYVKHI